MNKIKDIARIKKESEEELDLLTRIKNLKRTDREGFKSILDELGITYTTLGNFLGITGGGVSVWVTAKSMDGISKSQYENVKRFLEGYYYLKQGDRVKPVSPNLPVSKSRHSELVDMILNDMMPRDYGRALADQDFETAWEFSDKKQDLIKEKAREIKVRLEQQGYST